MSAGAGRQAERARTEAKRRRALYTIRHTPEVAEAIDELTADMEQAVWHALTTIDCIPYDASTSFTGARPSWRDKSTDEILADLRVSLVAFQSAPEHITHEELRAQWLIDDPDMYTMRVRAQPHVDYAPGSISYTDGL